jgi:hypothetical protein
MRDASRATHVPYVRIERILVHDNIIFPPRVIDDRWQFFDYEE